MSEQQQPPQQQQEGNQTIPTVGPFIYDFLDRYVRSVDIVAVLPRYVVTTPIPTGNATVTEESTTRITIKKDGDGPIRITATYDFDKEKTETFDITVTNPNQVVDLNFENGMISIGWLGEENRYPIRQWFIPVNKLSIITVNKD